MDPRPDWKLGAGVDESVDTLVDSVETNNDGPAVV